MKTYNHYHVGINTPGYLPDSEPSAFVSYAEAVSHANYLKEDIEEQDAWADIEESEYHTFDEDGAGGWVVGDPTKTYDLGEHIFVDGCDDPACFAYAFPIHVGYITRNDLMEGHYVPEGMTVEQVDMERLADAIREGFEVTWVETITGAMQSVYPTDCDPPFDMDHQPNFGDEVQED